MISPNYRHGALNKMTKCILNNPQLTKSTYFYLKSLTITKPKSQLSTGAWPRQLSSGGVTHPTTTSV